VRALSLSFSLTHTTEGPDVVADALAKLSSLSATAIEHLGPDATAGNKNTIKRDLVSEEP